MELFDEVKNSLRGRYERATELHLLAWKAELDGPADDARTVGSQIKSILEEFQKVRGGWEKTIVKIDKELERIEAAINEAITKKRKRKGPVRFKVDGEEVTANLSVSELLLVDAMLKIPKGETYADAYTLFEAAWKGKKAPSSIDFIGPVPVDVYLGEERFYAAACNRIAKKLVLFETHCKSDEYLDAVKPTHAGRFERLIKRYGSAEELLRAFPKPPEPGR